MTVAATMALVEASRRRWDVVVVGAGPAGALTAYALARGGTAVLLVDRARFPRSKVCGCCLNGAALAVLDAVGLGELPARHGAQPLTDLFLATRGRSARVKLGRGVSLSRETFDAALVQAAIAAGADFVPDTQATLGALTPDSRAMRLDSGGQSVVVTAGAAIAADGLGGRLLDRAGLVIAPADCKARIGAGVIAADAPDCYRAGAVYMACAKPGYVGLVRLEDGRLDVAAAFDVAQVRSRRGPGNTARFVLDEVGWPAPPGLERLDWRGTPLLTRQANRLAAPRVFAVGDAAGYVEPFTGEGMAWALASGLAVAPLAARAAARWDSALEAEWAATHRRVVGRRQFACRAAAFVLRRPRLARAIVGLLSFAPGLAVPVVRGLDAGPPLPLTP